MYAYDLHYVDETSCVVFDSTERDASIIDTISPDIYILKNNVV